MIRKLVAEKLNIPWNNIRLQRTAKGKPVLAKDSLNPYPNFNFNISHQGDYAVLAAEPELQVGIDIMKTSFPGNIAFLSYMSYSMSCLSCCTVLSCSVVSDCLRPQGL